MKSFCILIATLFIAATAFTQQPRYTKKYFAAGDYPSEFKRQQSKDGPMRTYIQGNPPIWDVDDDNTTHVQGGQRAMLCIEGNMKNGKREGIFQVYLIDSFQHDKRYRIWEQSYKNDKLNGEWKVYNLKGTLVQIENYSNDSLKGISRNYWIDGKTIMEENEFLNGRNKYINRKFFGDGKVAEETTIENGMPNGEAKKFYESGALMDKATLKNGELHGLRTYYYENGKPWIEQIYDNGKPWTIVANYDSKGNKRNAGTLKDGNGTVIFYDDDTTVRETVTYVNGIIKR